MTTKELFIHYLLCILFALLLFLCIGYTAHATEVTLQWNASDGATGYKIYYGNASRVYRSPIDTIQDTTTYVMTFINPGTYYFAVTAYNEYGESGYSNEVGPISIPIQINIPDLNSVNSQKLDWIMYGPTRIWWKYKGDDELYYQDEIWNIRSFSDETFIVIFGELHEKTE